MTIKERGAQVVSKSKVKRENQPCTMTISEARRKAFEASEKAQQAQILYSEEEAKRWYDYRVEE
ncbi:MAG: hypothetical protein WCD76_11825 [Pyrinomonadaceae bacterium]